MCRRGRLSLLDVRKHARRPTSTTEHGADTSDLPPITTFFVKAKYHYAIQLANQLVSELICDLLASC